MAMSSDVGLVAVSKPLFEQGLAILGRCLFAFAALGRWAATRCCAAFARGREKRRDLAGVEPLRDVFRRGSEGSFVSDDWLSGGIDHGFQLTAQHGANDVGGPHRVLADEHAAGESGSNRAFQFFAQPVLLDLCAAVLCVGELLFERDPLLV